MNEEQKHLDTLQDIKQMMDRSSRFISLSGLSGIAAGVCALGAVIYIWPVWRALRGDLMYDQSYSFVIDAATKTKLIGTGGITFISALLLAFLFTWLRSKKTYTAIWGSTARRLVWNTAIPLLVGGVLVIRLLQWELVGLIAPTCLIFYGLALLNGSKYTVSEVRWLGICQLILGVINLWFIGYGLIAWAIGFGVLHIVYGSLMWWKYERA